MSRSFFVYVLPLGVLLDVGIVMAIRTFLS
jgi:hypothetical protein